jgi:hypothetical protein
VLDELSSAKLLRAVYSERQLEEVLADFWFNHFNVFARKGRVRRRPRAHFPGVSGDANPWHREGVTSRPVEDAEVQER